MPLFYLYIAYSNVNDIIKVRSSSPYIDDLFAIYACEVSSQVL